MIFFKIYFLSDISVAEGVTIPKNARAAVFSKIGEIKIDIKEIPGTFVDFTSFYYFIFFRIFMCCFIFFKYFIYFKNIYFIYF